MEAVVVISFIICLTSTVAQKSPAGPPGLVGPVGPNCNKVSCRRPLCADPVSPPGKCCPSCSKSKCKFRGCVHYEPGNKVIWRPEPCMKCDCYKGKERCGAYFCPRPPPGLNPCFGSPMTKIGYRPYVCCPRCDFGIPEQACRAVTSERRSFSITHQGSQCFGTAIQYKCDKVGYRKGGKKFRCVEVRKNRYLTLRGSRCLPFTRIAYKDVISCKAEEDSTVMKAEGCDLFIRTGVRGAA